MEHTRRIARRVFLELSGAAVAGVVLAACAPPAPEAKEVIKEITREVPVETVVKETVVVQEVVKPLKKGLLQYLILGAGREPQQLADVQKIFDQFAQLHPGLTVEVVMVPGQGVADLSKFQAMIAAGTPPDLVSGGYDDGASFAWRDALLDVRPLIDRDGIDLSDQDPMVMSAFTLPTKNNMLFGYPHGLNTEYVFYNRDIFDAAGASYPISDWNDASWTWSTYVDLAKEVTKRSADGKIEIWGSSGPAGGDEWIFPYQYGADFTDPDETRFILDRPEAWKGLQLAADSIYVDKIAPTPAESELLTEGAFVAGTGAMTLNGTWALTTYKQITNFKWDVAAWPLGEGMDPAKPRGNPYYQDGLMISSKDYQEETWELIKFILLKPDVYEFWFYQVMSMFPTALSSRPRWIELAKAEMPTINVDAVSDGFSHGSVINVLKNRNKIELYNTWRAELWDPVVLEHRMTAEEACMAANEKLTAMLAATS